MPNLRGPALRALIDAFVAANGADPKSAGRYLLRGFRAGLAFVAAREAMRMVHLFGGFPRTLGALEALAAAERDAKLGSQRLTAKSDKVKASEGDHAFKVIYGPTAPAVRAFIESLDPIVALWIREHAYARVLSRPGLTIADRELLAVAALTATQQAKQLASHARGALRAGASPRDVALAFTRGTRGLAPEVRAALREFVNKACRAAAQDKR